MSVSIWYENTTRCWPWRFHVMHKSPVYSIWTKFASAILIHGNPELMTGFTRNYLGSHDRNFEEAFSAMISWKRGYPILVSIIVVLVVSWIPRLVFEFLCVLCSVCRVGRVANSSDFIAARWKHKILEMISGRVTGRVQPLVLTFNKFFYQRMWTLVKFSHSEQSGRRSFQNIAFIMPCFIHLNMVQQNCAC